MYKLIALALLFVSVVLAQGRVGTTPPLWAGISVNEPLAIEGQTTGIQISFTIVNDGEAPIDANRLFERSELSINGVPLIQWRWISGNGPRDVSPVQPGSALRLTIQLGKYFEKPGIYTVSWSGPGYEAGDITFRVLPKPVQ
jgi:hypothetical protein